MEHESLPAGTRIRFTRRVTQKVSDTYTHLHAAKGWTGEIIGESDKKEYPYRVKTDRYHSTFVANRTEFEPTAPST